MARLPCTHFVALGVGQDGVLSCQGDAAGRDHQENAHLKVAQTHDVVAGPADPGAGGRAKGAASASRPPPLTPHPRAHQPPPDSQALARGSHRESNLISQAPPVI